MEKNTTKELGEEIEKWLENKLFVAFANKRMNNVLLNKRHSIDPMFEEMDEGFDEEDEYVVPMVEYLSSRLQRRSSARTDASVSRRYGGYGMRLPCRASISRCSTATMRI